MLKSHGKIESYEEIKQVGRNVEWLIYFQIVSRIKGNIGYKREVTKDLIDSENIILQSKGHRLTRIYKLLLQLNTEKEQVKTWMIK